MCITVRNVANGPRINYFFLHLNWLEYNGKLEGINYVVEISTFQFETFNDFVFNGHRFLQGVTRSDSHLKAVLYYIQT